MTPDAPGPPGPKAAVLAVDGGNSKADLALVGRDGSLLAAVRGPSISHQAVGLDAGMANLAALAQRASAEAGEGAEARGGRQARGGAAADIGVFSLAGADYPEDIRLLDRAIGARELARDIVILNDTFGALRAGTHRPWGLVLICGQGINAAGIAPDGRAARFDAVGEYAGDWGGGGGIGRAAIAAAVRGRDGRGPRTALERLVPAHFGLASPPALTKAFYFERIDEASVSELSPVVFRAAASGDAVAREILDRLADELVAMARALVRRLRLSKLDPEVVLAGGVFKADDADFHARVEAGVRAAVPNARLVRLIAPPVLGAALIGLDRLSSGTTEPDVEACVRSAFEGWTPRS
jgi:N-acetylglucosamine kinase-like BadF-type ATPase